MVLRRVVFSPVAGCTNERVSLIVSLAVFGGAAPLVAGLEQVSFFI
jgi:hypothetical protein